MCHNLIFFKNQDLSKVHALQLFDGSPKSLLNYWSSSHSLFPFVIYFPGNWGVCPKGVLLSGFC